MEFFHLAGVGFRFVGMCKYLSTTTEIAIVPIFRSKPYWTTTPKEAAHWNSFKTWVAMADAEHTKYLSPPPAIDFESAKQKIKDKGLVDILESFYKSNEPAPETFEWPEEDKLYTDHHLAYIRDCEVLAAEALPVLEKEVEFLKSTRTNRDTTYLDMCAKYPSIHEEIEDEIEERDWFNDTGLEPDRK